MHKSISQLAAITIPVESCLGAGIRQTNATSEARGDDECRTDNCTASHTRRLNSSEECVGASGAPATAIKPNWPKPIVNCPFPQDSL